LVGKSGAEQGGGLPQIKWLPEALADFERLHDFVYSHSPDASARAAQTLLDGAQLLRTSPALGRLMPDDSERRELFLPFGVGAYVLRTRLHAPETVVIIRIWHSRENRAE